MQVKTVKCKLEPDNEQWQYLKKTLQSFADACNFVLQAAKRENTTNRFKLQKLCYKDVRQKFGLTANLAIRVIGRVSQAAKRSPKKVRSFRATSVDYDQRIFSYNHYKEQVSLSTIGGRLKIPLRLGNYQRHLLKGQKPTFATLIYKKRKKEFYINIVLPQPVPQPSKKTNPVGVDLGINNIATCSNGLRFSGKKAKHIRRRFQSLRASLQAKGTRGAKNTLRRLSGKERRWMRDLNHLISKKIVDSIKEGEFIVMEKLTHIRERAKTRKSQRYIHNSWPFRQLQQFIQYKALEKGIPVIFIDPKDTSKVCSRCGRIGHRSGSSFSCSCGYKNHADFNASYNISLRGNALKDGLQSMSPEVAPADAKGSSEQLRPRAATSP